jgi:aminoglycoside phosphotransferase (APT) family kinase protein
LAKLHQVDHVAVGLESYGKPTGFYRRQIASLTRVAAAQAAAKDAKGVEVGPIPGMEEMIAWFKDNEVKDSTSIVHGDYKVRKRKMLKNICVSNQVSGICHQHNHHCN